MSDPIEEALLEARSALNEVLSELRQISNDLNLHWAAYTKRTQPTGRNKPTVTKSDEEFELPSAATAQPARRVPPRRRSSS
jgi:hypothetical protein